MFSLQKKNAIITGGGSGIGKAIAKLFAKQGATVFIFDLDKIGADDAVKEISAAGGTTHFIQCNVADQQNVREAVQQVNSTYGTIHILVNNAGVAHVGNAENTSEEDFTRLFNINVKGVYNCMHEVLPVMKTTGGVILNMGSIAAMVGIPDRFAYSMTKGAVAAMSISTAKDYLQYNIRCNSISPARVHTPFVDGFIAKNYPGKEKEMFEKLSKSQPIGRMGTVDEIAALALYLCSDEAGFITGNDYPVDGGFVKLNN
jgi:2-keto-3-deoxy-L-fuconate dehydrogenase